MNIDINEPAWITVEQMRKHLGLSKTKAYEIATDGSVNTVRIGRSLRIDARSLARWLEAARYTKGQEGDEME